MDTHQERGLAIGKMARKQAPRSSHGDWTPAADRPDPISLLQAQDESRIQKLVPIKYGRMIESPFAFLRGSAVVMAADLARTPVSGLETMLCGDAHLANFGVFATPERRLAFDLNDFDEAYPGPWEWDLKRLATSVSVAGRANGFSDTVNRDLAELTALTYREAMRHFSDHTTLDMWYYHVDADKVLALFKQYSSKRGQKGAKTMVVKARKRTQEHTLEKITSVEGGQRRFVSSPPLLVPFRADTIDQFVEDTDAQGLTREIIENAWQKYLASLPAERRFLLQRYRIVDAALRVGGVGSVGTRCSIVLLEGRGVDDAIILQLKEAGPSVLENYVDKRDYQTNAARVVTAQRLIQASSDMFLGWHESGLTGLEYYWRQLKDLKGSIDVELLGKDGLKTYSALCAWSLARAHARTGRPSFVSGYLGKNDAFAQAIGQFALTYADRTEQDHQLLERAVQSGRISAERGV